jgi:hypothetical protein
MADKPTTSLIDAGTKELKLKYGKFGYRAMQLSMRKSEVKKQQYSVSLIAAIS